jgi:hypothetical protein
VRGVHIAVGGGKDRAQDASDYGRDRARAAQDRFNRGYENTPSGGDIRREGKPLISVAKDVLLFVKELQVVFVVACHPPCTFDT